MSSVTRLRLAPSTVCESCQLRPATRLRPIAAVPFAVCGSCDLLAALEAERLRGCPEPVVVGDPDPVDEVERRRRALDVPTRKRTRTR